LSAGVRLDYKSWTVWPKSQDRRI